ncbi:hypothetical protein PAPYR_5031 [Paratrimastix pyriformis]|uniref:F-box domain-containing protein n=1 Tax=Paratrimastix pyriformis TaxID=342808 RepID=A0ABQ8UQJ7_9EUKA|nr:hypothetical protein PAPYR_5031 [Paratrimastix pyriformis]
MRFQDEILLLIFKDIDIATVSNCSLVCTQWRTVLRSERLWARYCLRDLSRLQEEMKLASTSFYSFLDFDPTQEESWRTATRFGISRRGWRDTYRLYMLTKLQERENQRKDRAFRDARRAAQISFVQRALLHLSVIISMALFFVSFYQSAVLWDRPLPLSTFPHTRSVAPALVALCLLGFSFAALLRGPYFIFVPVVAGGFWLLPALHADGYMTGSSFRAMGAYWIIVGVASMVPPAFACLCNCCRFLLPVMLLELPVAPVAAWLWMVCLKKDGILEYPWTTVMLPLASVPLCLLITVLLFRPGGCRVFLMSMVALPLAASIYALGMRFDGSPQVAQWSHVGILRPLWATFAALFLMALVWTYASLRDTERRLHKEGIAADILGEINLRSLRGMLEQTGAYYGSPRIYHRNISVVEYSYPAKRRRWLRQQQDRMLTRRFGRSSE